MHISLLGPLRVEFDGTDVAPSAPKLRAVVALLALRAGRVVPVAALLEELWGQRPPATAMTTLQTYVYQLRRLFAGLPGGDGLLVTRAPGYLLAAAPSDVDVWHFERLHARARAELADGHLAGAAATLREALALWRGDALGDVRRGTVLDGHATALAEQRLAAVELRVDADLALGEHPRLIGELRELTARHPLHEGFHARLMTALARGDRRSEALDVYRDLRARLRAELRTDPGASLRAVQAAVLAGDAATGGAARALPARTRPPVPAQLPADTADFLGRSRELSAVADVLRRAPLAATAVPLVAVTGTLGIGKTALAVRAAHQHRSRYPDGQFFVDLGGTTGAPVDPGDALAGLLRAVGGPDADVPPVRLGRAAAFRSWAADRAVLMVLDDAADAAQVLPLLPPGPGSAVLVVSRAPLAGLPVTLELPVPPLSPPEAVDLVAAIIGPARVAAEPAAAARIARSCGYHPLVVRAFAERIRLDRYMGLAGLARYLSQTRAQAAELRAYDPVFWRRIADAYGRLDEPARTVFRVLGRLSDTFTRDQVRRLLRDADAVAVVLRLLEDGLVTQLPPERGGEPRYRLPEPVRLYAAVRLEAETEWERPPDDPHPSSVSGARPGR